MFKPEQSILQIEPLNELRFKGPFTAPVMSYIKLTNLTDKEVYFKLKTTAPKRYCVRPNSGHLSNKEACEVQVVLQPFIFSPNEKPKHKFMIQYVVVEPDSCFATPEDLWKCIAPDKILNYKLKCIFEMAMAPGSEMNAETTAETKSATIVADEKIKKSSDNYKTTAPSSLVVNGVEVQKVAAEVKKLREIETKLQKENLDLKDEISRLNEKLSGKDRSSYSPPAVQHTMYSEKTGTLPMYYIGIAVLVAVFSFLFGKFV